MSTKLPYPDFESEAEEAAWVSEHDEELDQYFSPMDVSVREMLLRDHELVLPEAVLSIPLSREDLEKTKSIAASEGLEAQEYVVKILQERLDSKRAA